jgi:arabinose-5-phosphate isomerase
MLLHTHAYKKMDHDVNILNEISQVLDIEIEGLRSVRSNLTHDFVTAVETIASCKGQVFVTGIGKSGIIANKIASTFRSTGTPSTFLHAGEALHGDIGIVSSSDVVLAIGKSGETSELNSLLRILKKNGIAIISLTSNGSSSMAELSDVVLDLKISREACPLNLAPTTSTTVALAVGDAIAVALMKLKHISAEDFARRHPGGQLGARLLLRVRDVMKRNDQNPVIPLDLSVKEMLVRITSFRVGGVSVIGDGGLLLGLVTDYDVRRALESDRDIFSMTISEIMNPRPDWVHEDTKAVEALEMMRQRSKPIALLPVLNKDGCVVGMIHLHDLVAAGL